MQVWTSGPALFKTSFRNSMSCISALLGFGLLSFNLSLSFGSSFSLSLSLLLFYILGLCLLQPLHNFGASLFRRLALHDRPNLWLPQHRLQGLQPLLYHLEQLGLYLRLLGHWQERPLDCWGGNSAAHVRQL